MAETNLVTVDKLANFVGLSERRCQQLSREGVMFKSKHGEYKFLESVSGYIKYLQASLDGKESERGPKYDQEVRKLRRENDLEEGMVAPVSEIVSVVRPLITMLSQKIDLLPGIAADACKEVDGRGRERMAKALVTEKNELARIPERLLNTSTTVVN